ncbi:hypothetical protein N0V90_013261 [Kalmusia sp. IMI 367209]|nr:hypothetical protein N0V90_013261 [Kalmusia sp. IMI 367209]
MTDYMAQGLNLPPSSRQDIISALLDGYGNSFEGDDSSPYKLSPVPSFKELPPPPPPERARERDYTNNKPLPAVGYMNMRFQLRAQVPGVPTVASHSESQIPSETPATEEKSLPPPPPEKSERRSQQSTSGDRSSKERPPRKDSLQSQDGQRDPPDVVKRKPLAKFTSLAELGNGPRGGKGGPLPQPRVSKQSVEEKSSEDRPVAAASKNVVDRTPRENKALDNLQAEERSVPKDVPRVINPLPPTPKDDTPAPPPPSKKPFGGMGLPSNPKHKKGKSNTGFDLLKDAASPQLQQLPAPNTITPGPTPSPNKTEQMQQKTGDRPQNLLGDAPTSSTMSNDQRRPFSFEVVAPPPPQKPAGEVPRPQATAAPASIPAMSVSPVSDVPSLAQPTFPPRSASRAPPPAFASLPSQQRSGSSEDMDSDSAPPTPSTPPFVPLTEAPAPSAGPPITERHHNCYSRHATFVWSRNNFQPMACMVCKNNDQERKWSCVWCCLRICVDCSRELNNTPGRNLQAVIDARGRYDGSGYPGIDEEEQAMGGMDGANEAKRHDSGNPTLVVWNADAEDDGDRMDFS